METLNSHWQLRNKTIFLMVVLIVATLASTVDAQSEIRVRNDTGILVSFLDSFGNLNATGRICDSFGCIGSGSGSGGWVNTSGDTRTSLNVTIEKNLTVGGWSTIPVVNNPTSFLVKIADNTEIAIFADSWIFNNGASDCTIDWGSEGVLGWTCATGINLITDDVTLPDGNLSIENTAAGGGYLFVEKQINATGNITSDEKVCDSTGCIGEGHDGTGGWINDSVQTNTSLNVNVGGNLSFRGGRILMNSSSISTPSRIEMIAQNNVSMFFQATNNFMQVNYDSNNVFNFDEEGIKMNNNLAFLPFSFASVNLGGPGAGENLNNLYLDDDASIIDGAITSKNISADGIIFATDNITSAKKICDSVGCIGDGVVVGDGTGSWLNDSIQTNTSVNVNIQNGANLTVSGNITALGLICDSTGCIGSGSGGNASWNQTGADDRYRLNSSGDGTGGWFNDSVWTRTNHNVNMTNNLTVGKGNDNIFAFLTGRGTFIGGLAELISDVGFTMTGNDLYVDDKLGVNGIAYFDTTLNVDGTINADATGSSISADGDISTTGTGDDFSAGGSFTNKKNAKESGGVISSDGRFTFGTDQFAAIGGNTTQLTAYFGHGGGRNPPVDWRFYQHLNATTEFSVGGVTGTGKAVCVKANGDFGVCSTAVGPGGTCTCG